LKFPVVVFTADLNGAVKRVVA